MSVAPTSSDNPEPRKRGGRPRRTDWQDRFIESFQSHGVQAWACEVVKVNPDTVAAERKRNPEFAARYDEAFELSTASLEFSAFRWASQGWPIKTTVTKEVVQISRNEDAQGNVTVSERVVERITTTTESLEKSAAMTIFMLKARRPEVYRESIRTDPEAAGGQGEIKFTREERDAAVEQFGSTVVRLADRRSAASGT